MVLRTTNELRISAVQLREMASEGSDASLREALLLVAEDFEREAEKGKAMEMFNPPHPGEIIREDCLERWA